LTPESLAFVESFLSPSSSSADKLSLFSAALAQHGKDMKLASNGLGIDRHIFGLKVLAAGLPEKEKEEAMRLLGDETVKESGTWKMSTSQIYIRRAPSYGCVSTSSFASS
jgi:carnitine O-acetyltransferase